MLFLARISLKEKDIGCPATKSYTSALVGIALEQRPALAAARDLK
jgi:hypothetical protein